MRCMGHGLQQISTKYDFLRTGLKRNQQENNDQSCKACDARRLDFDWLEPTEQGPNHKDRAGDAERDTKTFRKKTPAELSASGEQADPGPAVNESDSKQRQRQEQSDRHQYRGQGAQSGCEVGAAPIANAIYHKPQRFHRHELGEAVQRAHPAPENGDCA